MNCKTCSITLNPGVNFCQTCGAPVETKRNVGFLGLGIFFLPWLFSWFTLRTGYSTLTRGIAFGWGFVCLLFVLGGGNQPAAPNTSNAPPTLSASAPSRADFFNQPVPSPTPEATPDESLRLPTELTPAQLKKQRIDTLCRSYEAFLAGANPHLNYIRVATSGKALWGKHSYFGQYSLKIGPFGPALSGWIDENRAELNAAGITRVGVRDADGYGGYSYFDLR